MTGRLKLTVLILSAFFAVFLCIAVRNHEFESAARALKTGDYSTAVPRLRALALLGYTPAQYIVGQMYATGVGIEKNDSEAIRWFRKAAVGTHGEADPAAAELAVSRAYSQGTEGVKPDPSESMKWLRWAADGGSKEAVAELERSRTQR